ncbi:MAG TPA: hypothetical protein VFF51_03225 [Candidatus Methylomirabilis sp.]|nr:hypothetical protein [Candidatus Methylomirabilis sp.]
MKTFAEWQAMNGSPGTRQTWVGSVPTSMKLSGYSRQNPVCSRVSRRVSSLGGGQVASAVGMDVGDVVGTGGALGGIVVAAEPQPVRANNAATTNEGTFFMEDISVVLRIEAAKWGCEAAVRCFARRS